jgi:hypothetical protein
MFKRVCALISVFALVALVGCGSAPETPTTTTPSAKPPTTGGGDKPKEKKKEAAAAAFPKDKATASLKGVVSLEGEAPKMTKIDMSGAKQCADLHKDPVVKEEVVANGGKLANVVVYVKSVDGKPIEDVWSFDAPSTEANIDQKGCTYVPHILAVQADQPVAITSSDDLAHNIHYVPGKNPEFNESQQKAGSKKVVKFSEPEMGANMVCNIHGWMKAYLFVFPHPFFAVTKADGSYEFAEKLPPGEYEIAVWQESEGQKLGKVDPVKVTLADKDAKEQNFAFKVK